MESKQIKAEQVLKIALDPAVVDHFSTALKIRTVSPAHPKDFDSIQFDAFNTYLKTTFPRSDSLLEHHTFNRYSHLYHWKGTDEQLAPIVLMGHLDVVPVIDENRKYWKEDPFGGIIEQDTLWGRGAIDDKVSVIAIMESLEHLLKEGFRPARDLYIAIGHDEEIGGLNGAKTIAAYLEEQGVKPAFVLDEGGSLISGMIPGIDGSVALIGVAEKGFVSLELSVEMEGGHSSMPANETAIDVLSKAIYTLKSNPFPTQISPAIESFLSYLGPEMPFVNKMAFANIGLFKPLIINVYESSPSSNALIRTTTSPTIFNSGVKENIIPLSAKATVNFRILSGTSIAEVISFVKTTIDDERIAVKEGSFNSEPSAVSDVDGHGFETIHKSIAQIFPEVIVSPYLVVGATDSRYFNTLSDQVYRFSPIRITKSNIKSFHGLNERIALVEYENAIRFYVQLIKNASE